MKYFLPVEMLYSFIISSANPFVDISLTTPNSSFCCFLSLYVFSVLFFFKKSSISSLVGNFACFIHAAKFSGFNYFILQ